MTQKERYRGIVITATILTMLMGACNGGANSDSYESYDSYYPSIEAASTSSSSGIGNFLNEVSLDRDKGYANKSESTDDYEISTDTSIEPSTDKAEITLLEEKLVYTSNIDIETKAYNSTYSGIKGIISRYNGIIQYEKQSNKDSDWYYSYDRKYEATLNTYIKCRIPSSKYKEFIAELENLEQDDGITKITSNESTVDNISQQYYDNVTRIEALKIQQNRLLEMLETAYSISDMITIEDRLTEVEYELNKLTTQVKYMDMDVAYSYVNIRLQEVMEITSDYDETTFLGRLWEEVKDAWEFSVELLEGFISFLLHALPVVIIVFIPLGIIGYFVLKLLIRIVGKKYNKYKEKEMSSQDPNIVAYKEFLNNKDKENKDTK